VGTTEQAKERRDSRRAAGLCGKCSNPALLGKSLCELHRQQDRKINKRFRVNQKQRVIAGYGGKCQCEGGCDESRFEFLTIDHVNNDGAEHRRNLGSGAIGPMLYKYIIDNNFPEEYRLLCWNCNCAKGHYGECPHVNEKNAVAAMSVSAGGK